MTSTPKIRGDKLVLANLSVLRTLIIELDKAGAVDVSTVLDAIDDTVRGLSWRPGVGYVTQATHAVPCSLAGCFWWQALRCTGSYALPLTGI